eukprot:1341046-Amorphochlora_amoeboformis.AAC.1
MDVSDGLTYVHLNLNPNPDPNPIPRPSSQPHKLSWFQPKSIFPQLNIGFYAFTGAYKAMGFGKFGDNPALSAEASKRLKKPEGVNWWKYLSNVVKLSPIPKGEKIPFGQVPEGVKRLGGTFVVNGENIVYSWADGLP